VERAQVLAVVIAQAAAQLVGMELCSDSVAKTHAVYARLHEKATRWGGAKGLRMGVWAWEPSEAAPVKKEQRHDQRRYAEAECKLVGRFEGGR
jgi:hypothetical protein